jgi:hypothetical protein
MSTVFVVTRYDTYQDTKNVHSVHSTEEAAKAAQDAIDASLGQHAFYDSFELDASQEAAPEKALTWGYYMELGLRGDTYEGTGYASDTEAASAMNAARAGRPAQRIWIGTYEGYIAPTTLGLLVQVPAEEV